MAKLLPSYKCNYSNLRGIIFYESKNKRLQINYFSNSVAGSIK